MASNQRPAAEVSAAFNKAAIDIVRMYQDENAWKEICHGKPNFLGLSEKDALSITPAIIALDMGLQPVPRAVWTVSMLRSALLTMFSGWRPEVPPVAPTPARPFSRPVMLGRLRADASSSTLVQDVPAPNAGRDEDREMLQEHTEVHKALKTWIRKSCAGLILIDKNGKPVPLDHVKFADPQTTFASIASSLEYKDQEEIRTTMINSKKRVIYMAQLHLHASRVSNRPQVPLSCANMLKSLLRPDLLSPNAKAELRELFGTHTAAGSEALAALTGHDLARTAPFPLTKGGGEETSTQSDIDVCSPGTTSA